MAKASKTTEKNIQNDAKEELTPEQKRATEYESGPMLILAGPGTGKTKTLVERAVHLIVDQKVAPERIVMCTFTNKAARELITRISQHKRLKGRKPIDYSKMYIGTIHSICLRILEENHALPKNYELLQASDQEYYVQQRFRKKDKAKKEGDEEPTRVEAQDWTNVLTVAFPPSPKKEEENKEKEEKKKADRIQKLLTHGVGEALPSDGSKSYKTDTARICTLVSKLIEECITPEELLANTDERIQAAGKIYKEYLELLDEHHFIDFSTILSRTYALLQDKTNGVLQKLHDQIDHVLIDEYQDTNTIQEKIMLLLANKPPYNICVVGDDDQSLYRFRGAVVSKILDFRATIQDVYGCGCEIFRLFTNFRSRPNIIEECNRWITEDKLSTNPLKNCRLSKEIEPSSKKSKDTGTAVYKIMGKQGDHSVWQNKFLNMIEAYIESLEKNDNRQPTQKGTLKDKVIYYKKEYEKAKEEKRESKYLLKDLNKIVLLSKSVGSDSLVELIQTLEDNGIPVYSPRSGLFFYQEEIRLAIGCLLHLFPKYFETISDEKYEYRYTTYTEYLCDCHALVARDMHLYNGMEDWITTREEKYTGLLKKYTQGRMQNKESSKTQPKPENADGFDELVNQLFAIQPFAEHLDTKVNGSNAYTLRKARNMALLSNLAAQFGEQRGHFRIGGNWVESTVKSFFSYFLRNKIQNGIEEVEDETDMTPEGSISFMTIHQAKGLEFPITIVSTSSRKETDYKEELIDVILQQRVAAKPKKKKGISTITENLKDYDRYDRWRLNYVGFSRAENILLTGTPASEKGNGDMVEFYRPLPEFPQNSSAENPFISCTLKDYEPVRILKPFSYTGQIGKYYACPLQYKFHAELGFSEQMYDAAQNPFQYGQLVHQTIEDIHIDIIKNNGKRCFTDDDVREWYDERYTFLFPLLHKEDSTPEKQRKEREADERYIKYLKYVFKYIKYAEKHIGWKNVLAAEEDVSVVRMLDNLIEEEKKAWDKAQKAKKAKNPKEKEEPYKDPVMNGYIMRGKLDLVVRPKAGKKSDVVEIIDFKTGAKNGPLTEKYARQLNAYADLYEITHPGSTVGSLKLYYVSNDDPIKEIPRVKGKKGSADEHQTMAEFDKTLLEILHQKFEHTGKDWKMPSKDLCNQCSMRYYCAQKGYRG